MKPAEEKHLILACKGKGKSKKKNVQTLDIRESSWEKRGNKWVNPQGLSPYDNPSIKKIENWVNEITRISPAMLDGEKHELEEEDETNKLDHQLSAVEGHKKVEILDNRGTKQEAQITDPPNQQFVEPLGIELEKKPWIDNAKMITVMLASITLTILVILGNNLRVPKEQSILSDASPSNIETIGFSSPLYLKGIGAVYLYNQKWEFKTEEEKEQKVKPIVIKLLSAYQNLRFDNVLEPKDRITKIISEIDSKKIPMLVIVPEGKEKRQNNTKIWVSKSQSIFMERTVNNKTTWKRIRLKGNAEEEMKLPFLKSEKRQ